MRLPSPASSAGSFVCSDDEVIRGLKRLRITEQLSRMSSADDESSFDGRHKSPSTAKCNREIELREKMRRQLQSQLQQYQSQYAAMSQGPYVSQCDD